MSKLTEVRLRNLSHHYKETRALDAIDVSIEGPGVVGLVGRNGAGKSTLLSILAGLRTPSAGELLLDGHPVTHEPQRLRARVGLLAEPPALHDEMPVARFISWCAGLRGIARSRREAMTREAMRRCDIEDVAGKLVGELSHGYRKRVGIAQAIVHEPDLLLLDEPISGLDPSQILAMRALVRTLGERALVIVSSHILAEIAQTCDHVLMLEDGKLVLDKPWNTHGQELGELEREDTVTLEVVLETSDSEDARGILASLDMLMGTEQLSQRAGTARFITRVSREDHHQVARALVERGANLLTLREVDREAGELEELFVRFARQSDGPEEKGKGEEE